MKITKLSDNLKYRNKQKKIIAFFIEHHTNWFTINEVNKLCFSPILSRRCVGNILFELPLLEERRYVIINQRKYKLLCYKYSEEILELLVKDNKYV